MDSAALIRTLTYIQANLDGDLSLSALAAHADCSPPYFARRFSELMTETPKHYTARLRLEKAALRLVLLQDSILDIALDCGFTSPETFSRAFRRYFGVAPRTFRQKGRLRASAQRELPHRLPAAAPVSLSSTVVRSLGPMSLAFIRHTGPYEQVPIIMWDTLIDWARRYRLAEPYILLGIAHDAPGLTAAKNLRFDAALRVPAPFRSGRRIGHQIFEGGLFALTTSVGPLSALPDAYAAVFGRLLSDRSLACLGVPCLEFYHATRIASDSAIVTTDIAVPVRRRR